MSGHRAQMGLTLRDRRATRWRGAVLLAICMAAANGCSGSGHGSSASTPTSSLGGGLQAPSHPYGPFPYATDVQRKAFQAFLTCAAEQGVEYRGPFADSQGQGVLFGPVPGETVTSADRLKVSEHCPQMIVGVFATPSGNGHDRALFEKAGIRFVRCLRANGYPDFPLPEFGGGDPYAALEQLPFDWENQRFVGVVNKCIEPIRSYVFST